MNFVSSNRVVVVVVVVRRGGGEDEEDDGVGRWLSAAASEGWGERGEGAKTTREECGSGRARRKRGRDEGEMRMDARGEASRTDASGVSFYRTRRDDERADGGAGAGRERARDVASWCAEAKKLTMDGLET